MRNRIVQFTIERLAKHYDESSLEQALKKLSFHNEPEVGQSIFIIFNEPITTSRMTEVSKTAYKQAFDILIKTGKGSTSL